MKRQIKRVLFPVSVAIVFLLMTWVMVSNYNKLSELEKHDKQPVTTIATPLVGEQGKQGIQGLQGEQGEQGIQGERGMQGLQGTQGVQGLQGAQGIQGEQGVQGRAGVDGANGTNGKDGVPVTLACVIRTTNTLATRYVAWKYTDEPDSSYRNIYKLPTWAECDSPIDLRT